MRNQQPFGTRLPTWRPIRRTKALVIGLLAGVALIAVPTATAIAAHGAHSQAWPAGIPRVAAFSCAAQGGGTPLMPSSAERLAGGGYAYNYMIGGVENQYIVPPASFRPLTASAARLDEYGFPTRPRGAGLAEWTAAMARYTGVSAAHLCLGPTRTPLAPVSASALKPTRMTVLSLNWAGYATHSSRNTWNSVEGGWIQTRPGNCRCRKPAFESSWVGLGGFFNGAGLLQDGTSITQVGSRTAMTAWYEYLRPGGGVPEINIGTVKAGEKIFARTTWKASTHKATFFVERNGRAFAVKVKKLSSAFYNGRTAEWIDERPLVCSGTSCHLATLVNFGRRSWHEAKATTTSGRVESVSSQNTYTIVMVNNSRVVLAKPSGLSGAKFTDTWHRAA